MDPIINRQNKTIVDILDAVSEKLGHLSRQDAWNMQVCAECRTPVQPDADFRDEASRREYFITATCQACQDAFYDSLDVNDEGTTPIGHIHCLSCGISIPDVSEDADKDALLCDTCYEERENERDEK